MATKTYDPGQVCLTLGASIIQQWDAINVSRAEDSWTFITGTNGEVTRTKNLNKLGSIKVTLPQTSTDNDKISASQVAGSLISCALIDKSGTTIVTMPAGTVVKPADIDEEKESKQREWTITGEIPDPFLVGGN
jgi:hypothetical protein